MGILYDLIKKDIQTFKEFKVLEKNDYAASREYKNVKSAILSGKRIESLFNVIRSSAVQLYGNINNYRNELASMADLIGEDVGIIRGPKVNDPNMLNYEKILERIESHLDENKINTIVDNYNHFIENNYGSPVHPLNETINFMKNDLESLNPSENEMTQLEKQNILNSLDYINSSLIVKMDSGILDDVIDEVSLLRDTLAKNHLREYAENNNINPDGLIAAAGNGQQINFMTVDHAEADLLKPTLDKKINLDENFKDKIRNLNNLIESKSIMKNLGSGESGFKEYAFYDWFRKARQIKELVLETSKLGPDQREQKINNYKAINNLTNEFKAITEEYKEVLNYIKDNFDLSKVSLPGNIYSGRPIKIADDNLDNYIPNFPEAFDNDLAPYSVLLNGFSQLKSLCNNYHVTLDEFLDDPTKAFFKVCKNASKPFDEKANLPIEGNTFGKRLARLLCHNEHLFDIAYGLSISGRSLEFLNAAEDMNYANENFDSTIAYNIISKYPTWLDHGAIKLFNNVNNGTDEISLKNLFACGETTENLFSLSKEYRDEHYALNENYDAEYNNHIQDKANTDPVREAERVLNTLKDFLVERKYMYDHPQEFLKENDELYDGITPAKLFVSAKKYFDDYIYNNEIDITKIRNSDDREFLLDFMRDPTMVFESRFENEPNLFVEAKQETFDKLHLEFAQKWHHEHRQQGLVFIQNFGANNNKPNGFNVGKDINTILRDNKGGFFENLFKSTSNEYKALVGAIEYATNNHGPTFGDLRGVKFYAKKYLEYKITPGVREDKFDDTSKRRVEFARTILRSLNDLDPRLDEPGVRAAHNNANFVNTQMQDIAGPGIGNGNHVPPVIENQNANNHPNVTVNRPLDDLVPPSGIARDNARFQNKLKEDIAEPEHIENNIIDNNEKEIIKENNIDNNENNMDNNIEDNEIK